MAKISGLIFSADPIKDTLAAAKHLLEFTDEVVIIYSKSYKDYKSFISRNKDKRIRIFYALRLGYPEPFRHYGISLCRYDHIAMLDVDERFSDTGKAKALLDSGTADTYLLYRKELDGRNKNIYTKQYRLFSKNKINWRGYLHETPKVTGSRKLVPKEQLYIIHGEGNKGRWHYNELSTVFPVDGASRIALREAYVGYGSGKLSFFEMPIFIIQKYMESKKSFRNLPENNKIIIKKLKKQGITRYLGLDNPIAVKALNERYKNKKQGIRLLISLLTANPKKK
jgi:hypothetical protein